MMFDIFHEIVALWAKHLACRLWTWSRHYNPRQLWSFFVSFLE